MTVVRFLGESINLVMQEWLGATYAILELKVPILPKKERRASVRSGELGLLL
jgi:hypothetical protein